MGEPSYHSKGLASGGAAVPLSTTRMELNGGSRAVHYVGRRLKGRIMARKLVFFALLAVTLGIGFRASAEERYCSDTNARTLRVEMYPYVPNVEGMAWRRKE